MISNLDLMPKEEGRVDFMFCRCAENPDKTCGTSIAGMLPYLLRSKRKDIEVSPLATKA